jgi:hypothetical protein
VGFLNLFGLDAIFSQVGLQLNRYISTADWDNPASGRRGGGSPMGMGPIILTCLALTVHQSQPEVFHLNSRKVGLPINQKDLQRKNVRQFILLYSADEGATWQQGDAKQSGDSKPLEFHAPKDGVYWFLVQLVDLAGNQNPRDPYRFKPNLKVVVDTEPPQVQATAERQSDGNIQVRWSASEQYPDPGSVRVEYRADGPSGQWMPLLPPSGSFPLQGQHAFDPGPGGKMGEVHVRVRVKDLATNEGDKECMVPGTKSAPAAIGAGAGEGSPFNLVPPIRNEPAAQPTQLTSQQSPRPLLEAPPGSSAISPPQQASLQNVTNTAPAPSGGMPIPASIERPSAPIGPPETPLNSPAVKIVKGREVRLEFTVDKVGPSGLGNADVYVTLDKGRSWQKMPEEVPISLAKGADVHGPEPVSGSVGVQLPKEGVIYGFIVAVKSKAGRAPPPPKSGDAPEVLVEWDKTEPTGQLFMPQPDATQLNALVLGWEAKDRNMAENPITLEWAEQKDGPWNPIGEPQLANTGQYSWRLPDRLPPRVYLRMTMRDAAGNEARAQTDKPVLIDLSVPQTKITRVAPATR